MARAKKKHLRWWQGSLALLVGGIGAQVAGFVPVLVAIAWVIVDRGIQEPGALEPLMQRTVTQFAVLGPSIAMTGATMALVALVMPLLSGARVKTALGLRGAHWATFLVAPFGILSLGPTSDGMRRLMQAYLPDFTFGTLEGLDQMARSAPWFLVVPAMALVPGFAEELLFRGAFQNAIRNRGLALVLSAVLFALYHTDPHHVAAVLPLGFYLAWLRHRTGSTFVPIAAHVANNATAVIATLALSQEQAEDAFEWWWIPIGWVVCAITVAVVWFVTRNDTGAERDGPEETPVVEASKEPPHAAVGGLAEAALPAMPSAGVEAHLDPADDERV
ncbi:MAG: lysostaphin resistance A-like protein [Sandaracinaceae bacterium]